MRQVACGGLAGATLLLLGVAQFAHASPEDRLSRLLKVAVEPAESEVLVKLTGTRSPDFTSFALHEPHRVVLDWAGSTVDGARDEQSFDSGLVRRISTRQFNSESEKISRITIELVQQTTYRVETDGHRVVLRFADLQIPEPPAAPAPEPVEAPVDAESRPALIASLMEQELPTGPLTEPSEPPPPPPAIAAPKQVVHLAATEVAPPPAAPLVQAPPAAPEPTVAPPAVRLAASAPTPDPAPRKIAAPPKPIPALPVARLAPQPEPAAASVLEPAPEPDFVVDAEPVEELEPEPARLAESALAAAPEPNVAVAKIARDFDPGPRVMKYVGFRLKGPRSLVFIRCDGKARYNVTEEDGRIVLDLFDTKITLDNNRRALDTSYFPSAVTRVKATPSDLGTRVIIEMRDKVPFSVKRVGSQIQLLFDRPS